MRQLFSLDVETLGEACGIFAGDGGIYRTARSFVVEVRGGKDEAHYYTHTVRPLFEELFSKKLEITKRKYVGGHVIGIRVCGGEAMRLFHVFLEFPVGSKTHALRMPKIIFNNMEYWKPYVRGVFDSRGSLYLRRTGKGYMNPVIDISSPSISHLVQLREILHDIGFTFWLEKRNRKIRIAGRKNVERFFKEIKPHNIAKTKKFAEIMLR